MATLSCTKIMRNEGRIETYNAAPLVQIREVFQIITDDPEELKTDILVDAGSASPDNLPQERTAHPEDPTAILASRQLERDPATRTVWYCECVWVRPSNGDTNPLSRYEVRWRTVQDKKIAISGYLYDSGSGTFSGTLSPVTNSALDLPADPYEIPESFLEAAVLIRATTVPTWIIDYRDKVNSDTYTLDGLTIAAGTSLIQGVEISPPMVEQNVTFREIMLIIWIKDNWLLSFLDVGWHEIDRVSDPEGALRKGISDDNGDPVAQMVPLNGSGGILSPDETPVYRTYKVFSELPYSLLGLL